ncbi:MAG: transposase [Flavobacteriaceae bacterium]|nr:transposase [Flavobacteriaceae bacterium]
MIRFHLVKYLNTAIDKVRRREVKTNEKMKKDLKIRENELQDKTYWKNYLTPKSLPRRETYSQPKMWLPIIGGIVISLIVGYGLAFIMASNFFYIVPIILVTGLIVAVLYGFIVEKSNCINFKFLLIVLFGIVLLSFLFGEYFYYELPKYDSSVSFLNFFKSRFNVGMQLDDGAGAGSGTVILITIWVGILASAFFISWLMLVRLLRFLNNGVPEEVLEFGLYHLNDGKSKDQIRIELSQKRWNSKEDQDAVFNATSSFLRWVKFMKTMAKRN